MTPIPRPRPYDGPPILSYGFRPFFLVASIYAALAVAAWMPQYFGELRVASAFSPMAWHAHEMLFGFVSAVIAGFLLTAAPNWTGRLPLQGAPLLLLVLAWIFGRIAVAFSGGIGWAPAMAGDCAFLALVAGAIAREVVAGKNWRNLKVVLILAALLAANIGFHLEAHYSGGVGYAERAGVSLTLVLIMLVGGRIVPSFTQNWLAKMNPGRLPRAGGRADSVFVVIAILALSAWAIAPSSPISAMIMFAAALTQAVRLAGWAGWRAWRNPIVLVLHVADGFVPIGFALTAFAVFYPDFIPPGAGLHAWAVGAIGGMILAVMTRVSLGHTGRELRADWITNCIYLAVFVAALARVFAALEPARATMLLYLSGVTWSAAFLGFVIAYGASLARPRL